MLLHCSYEELQALRHGAHAFLHEAGELAAVRASTANVEMVEALLPRLDGDFTVGTIREQRILEGGVAAVVAWLRQEVDASVLATHPANERAVTAYFDYAHALSVLGRVRRVGRKMEAMVEVMTGRSVDDDDQDGFQFPD